NGVGHDEPSPRFVLAAVRSTLPGSRQASRLRAVVGPLSARKGISASLETHPSVSPLPSEVVRELEQENILDRPSPERAKIESWRLDRMPRRVLLQQCLSTGLRGGVDKGKK